MNAFTISEDISEETIHYIDKYIKTSINNVKRDFFKRQKRQAEIPLSSLEYIEFDIPYIDTNFDISEYIYENDIIVPIYDPLLANALKSLTQYQKIVLLRNVIMQIPLKEIAVYLGISLSMVKKHKHNALEKIRRSMKNHGYTGI